MKRQYAGVDAEEGLAAYHFNAPVLEVKRIVGRDCLWFKDQFIIETISDGEVGQGGDASRRRWGG